VFDMTVVLGIGTAKGAWFARSDDRERWEITGPALKGWEVSTLGVAPDGTFLAGTGSSWYGAAVHRSQDLEQWDQVIDGPGYPPEQGHTLERIWTFAPVGDALYCGVARAGLFRSDDNGQSWQPNAALNDHASSQYWQPGLGGLTLHRILGDPTDSGHLWVGISAVGVWETTDGGQTWETRNQGVNLAAPNEHFDIGYCVHRIVNDPADPTHIWRQDHMGVYRTIDGGRTWERIQNGLPGSGFGFVMVRDPAGGALFNVPLESDEYRMPVDGRLRVYRSTDSGDSWHASGVGLPDHPFYTAVLRDAMDVDGLNPGGVYFGTTGGEVWCSCDTGDTWNRLPVNLPRISSIKVLST
jgi:hypothetical protein